MVKQDTFVGTQIWEGPMTGRNSPILRLEKKVKRGQIVNWAMNKNLVV